MMHILKLIIDSEITIRLPVELDAGFATLDGSAGFGATGSLPPQPAVDVAATVLVPLFLSFGDIFGVKSLTGSMVGGFTFAAGAAMQQTLFPKENVTIISCYYHTTEEFPKL